MIENNEIPIIEPSDNGYYEIYDDGRKIWHKNKFPSNYQFNWEDDIELPELNETDLINQELSIVSQENTMKIKSPSEFVMPRVDVKDGDYIIILDEGEYRKLPQDPSREVLTFRIKLPSGDEKKLSMNATSQKELIVAWGDDSKIWIGKRCRVEIVRQKVFTQMKDVIFLHSEGSNPSVPEEEIPEKEEEEEFPSNEMD